MSIDPVFRQLFDPASSVLTYLLGSPDTGEAIVIDPVAPLNTLILAVLAESHLQLKYIIRTHVHRPDRIDSQGLSELTGAAFLVGENNSEDISGQRLKDGELLVFGNERIRVLTTPGHTPGCISLLWHDRLFCGDLMEIGGCGQAEDETNPGQMFDSVTGRIFTLPGEVLIYPCHDYGGRTVSSVAEERQRNPKFVGISRDLFIARMKDKAPRHEP